MFFSTYGFVTLQVCHIAAAAAAAKLLQSCLTLQTHRWQPTRLPRPWDSLGKNNGVGCISFSNAWKWKVKVKLLSWTAAYQTLPSMGFSRQEYWSGLPLPSPMPHYIWLNTKILFVCLKWNFVSLLINTIKISFKFPDLSLSLKTLTGTACRTQAVATALSSAKDKHTLINRY